jgi:signal recognition particle receptor subunit beta
MKKNTGYIALIFSLLLMIASNQTAYAQTDVEDEAAVSLKTELNYEEMNALIDKVVSQKFNDVIQFIKKYLLIIWVFFITRPFLIRIIITISFFPACFGIISSHVLGIYQNRNRWEKHPKHDLMFSYFIKSGTLQRKESYREAHSLLCDHKWSWVSFAGLAHRLGNYSNKSIMLMFAMSFGYIPLFILGLIEMVFRILLGTVWLLFFNLLHSLLLLITKFISFALIPLANIIDKAIRKTQYCPHCYETIYLPKFTCPSCGKVHEQLHPGRCGVLFVRCACNRFFLPCVSFTGRSFLASSCPSCSGELPAANPKHFSIAIIGGNNAGKTAFIAAMSNLYKAMIKHKHILDIEGKPDNYFSELYDMYYSGKASADNESRTYTIVHNYWKIKTDNLVLYDTLAKYIVSDSFPRSPKYFRYCNGIILMIDPLSVQHVQKEFKDKNGIETKYDSSDDTNQMVVQFIHQYNTICGFSTGTMSSIPVAVVINKVDIEIVKREIGMDKIKELYGENPSLYNNDENTAKDQICREYLTKIGLINVLNNIEAIFSNVSFFPVSAAGHALKEGKAFAPIGVMEPIAWIAKKGHSRIARLLSSGVKNINSKVIL